MSMISFANLPAPSRLWVFAADRALSEDERGKLIHGVEAGLAAWSAHGSPVTWGYELRYDQFLLVGVDERETQVTGCSIDSAVNRIRVLEQELGLSFLDHGRVFYRSGDAIRVTSRDAFRKLAEENQVGPETIVFNNIVATVGELQGGAWEVPVSRSWHARAFPLSAS